MERIEVEEENLKEILSNLGSALRTKLKNDSYIVIISEDTYKDLLAREIAGRALAQKLKVAEELLVNKMIISAQLEGVKLWNKSG